MERPLYELCPKLKENTELPGAWDDVVVEQVKLQKDPLCITLTYTAPRLMPRRAAQLAKDALAETFSGHGIFFVGRCAYRSLTQDDILLMTEELADEGMPLNGYLTDAKIEMGEQEIVIDVAKGCAMLEEMGFVPALQGLVHRCTGMRPAIQVVCTAPMEEQALRERLENKVPTQQAGPKKERQLATAKPLQLSGVKLSEKAPEVLYGKAFKPGKTTPLVELSEATGACVVWGDVFNNELRSFPHQKILTADISDGTYSVSIKHIHRGFEKLGGLGTLKNGDTLVVKGTYEYDEFSHEYVLKPSSILRVQRAPLVDTAENKRVELHLHTKLSQLDALCDPGEVVQAVAAMGHKAVAITDHGVVQAYPEAMLACDKVRKDIPDFKVIYGVEAYFVDDSVSVIEGHSADDIADTAFVVFDLETTGLYPNRDTIIEIGAITLENGEFKDEYATFVDPGRPIPPESMKVHHITDEMVVGAPTPAQAIREFLEYCKGKVLVAHNGHGFDMLFLRKAAKDAGLACELSSIDTLTLGQILYPGLSSYKLGTLAKHLQVPPFTHHRAKDDAVALAQVFVHMLEAIEERGVRTLDRINTGLGNISATSRRSHHMVLLVQNQKGLRNLYKIISDSHIKYYASGRGSRGPRVPRSLLDKHREGLLVGSACEAGELYRAVLRGAEEEEIKRIAGYYDYLEIMPVGNNEFLVRKGEVESHKQLQEMNKTILRIGKELDIPVVATADVHFWRPEDAMYRAIIQAAQKYDDADEQAPLYYRTTDEMLAEFGYLSKAEAYAVVVENPNKIADLIDYDVRPIPKDSYKPSIPGSEETLRDTTMQRAYELYGDPLPDWIEKRLHKELDSIINAGYAVLYVIAQKLVKYSEDHGYLVGSRGSVGSSAVAYFGSISEVNPLPPHYHCTACGYSERSDRTDISTGFDLPDAVCPLCGQTMRGDGNDIPFETFLGFEGDKEPDIDLNFSGEFQAQAHRYTEELFGKEHVFKAGTVSGLQEKTVYGYVKKYMEERGRTVNRAEENRLIKGCSGVKRTTGQHPGGMVVVPAEYEVYDFCPIQHPADDKDKGVVTTHFEFKYLHDVLLKLDELGHDIPTFCKHLVDLTGVDLNTIPMNDEKVMSLFASVEVMGVTPEDIDSTVGTFGIPEMGTGFVRQMLVEAQPRRFSDLIQISGLSHGTDVWNGNAQDLIRNGVCTISEVIGTRDGIMSYLIHKGVEYKTAFDVMELTRKGKIAEKGFPDGVEQMLRDHGVPDWYLGSCRKIKYMFPKAHAVAYLIAAVRMMWFKVYYPVEFYATYFTVRGEDIDYEAAIGGRGVAKKHMDDIRKRLQQQDRKDRSAKDEDMLTSLHVLNEYLCRGFECLPIELGKSRAKQYVVEEGKIRLPYLSLRGVGETAATSLENATAEGRKFLSVDELQQATGVSTPVIDALFAVEALGDMPKSNQISFFDA